MNTLQELLVILDGQKLGPGYLTPKPTALETVIDLKKGFDPVNLVQTPISPPALLMTPAWVGSLGAGRDAIWLNGVDGNLNLSQSGPAYVFTSSDVASPPPQTPFNAGNTTAGSQTGTFGGITGVRITTPKAGTLQSMSFFAATAGASVRCGLYADISGSPGAPGALLASSAIGVAAIGFNTLAVTGGPTLPAGKYWVAVMSQTTFDSRFENTGGAGQFLSSQAWNAGVLPNPFPGTASTGTFAFSFYATFLG